MNLRRAFDILDADGDGKISYEDLRAFYDEGQAEEDVIRSMMSLADSNRNGYVEYDEFEKVLREGGAGKGGLPPLRVGVMEDAFRVMDKDGDGRVGHQDLKAYLNWAGVEVDDEDVRAMIALAAAHGDGDGDGGVTFHALLRILAV